MAEPLPPPPAVANEPVVVVPPPPPPPPPTEPSVLVRAWWVLAWCIRHRLLLGRLVVGFTIGALLWWGISSVGRGDDDDDGDGAMTRNSPYGTLVDLGFEKRAMAMRSCAHYRDSPAAFAWLARVRDRVTNETHDPLKPVWYMWQSKRCSLFGGGGDHARPALLMPTSDDDDHDAEHIHRLGRTLAEHRARGTLQPLLDAAPTQEVFLVRGLVEHWEHVVAWTSGYHAGRKTADGHVRLFYRVLAFTTAGTLEPVVVEHHELLANVERWWQRTMREQPIRKNDDPPCFCPVYLGLFNSSIWFEYVAPGNGPRAWHLYVGVEDLSKSNTFVPMPRRPRFFDTPSLAARIHALESLVPPPILRNRSDDITRMVSFARQNPAPSMKLASHYEFNPHLVDDRFLLDLRQDAKQRKNDEHTRQLALTDGHPVRAIRVPGGGGGAPPVVAPPPRAPPQRPGQSRPGRRRRRRRLRAAAAARARHARVHRAV
jgi:hypothetical protein